MPLSDVKCGVFGPAARRRVAAATGDGPRGAFPRRRAADRAAATPRAALFFQNSAAFGQRELSIIYLELYKPICETGNSVAGLFINEPVHKLMGSVLM